MKCPKCDFYYTEVINSRDRDDGRDVYRRRRCPNCGKRFTTYERRETTNRERVEEMNEIRQAIPLPELMAGLAEECTELAQAALKLRRVWDGTNPTPTPEETAIDRFYEEIADVQLYLNQIDVNVKSIRETMERKEQRWLERLREVKNVDGSEVVS